MRLLIFFIFILCSYSVNGQIVRTHPYYKPLVQAQTCTYPLDTYTGAAGAYSVAFKLRTAYSGSAFRVRRSSDNTEQDIGFDGCHVDTTSLKSFVGSNDGFVVTLYDQEGSTNVTQSTSTAQARIVNAGVIERVSGKPTMYFDGGDEYNFTAFCQDSRIDYYMVQSTSDNTYLQFYATSGGGLYGFVAQSGSGGGTSATWGSPSLYTNGTLQTSTTRDNVYNALNGTYIVTMQNASTTSWISTHYFGKYGGFEFTGYVSQIIAWASDQSANRSGIVSAFNSQFGIY